MPVTSNTEDLSISSTSEPTTSTKSAGNTITTNTYQQMLDVLEDLLSHTHIFYDDYGTACNCNCNCTCTRGIL